MRRLIACSAVLLVVAAAVAANPPRVEYRNDRLTVDAEGAPVADILTAVKEQSGAEIRGEPSTSCPPRDADPAA
jgi:hypothetical protein